MSEFEEYWFKETPIVESTPVPVSASDVLGLSVPNVLLECGCSPSLVLSETLIQSSASAPLCSPVSPGALIDISCVD